MRARSYWGLCAVLGMLLLVGGCVTISPQQELSLGEQSHGKIETDSGGLYADQAVQEYVNQVGRTVSYYAGRPDMAWQFKVVNSDQINAFAVPGGYIYITKGLLFKLRNEAELAGILGHESGHIAHRDTATQLQRQQGLQVGAGLAGIFGGETAGTVAALGANLLELKYDRGQEHDADIAGLEYMTKAGFNPKGLVQAMEVIKASSGSGGKSPEFLATHPDPGNRIEYLNEAIQKSYGAAAQSGVYRAEVFRSQVLDRKPTK